MPYRNDARISKRKEAQRKDKSLLFVDDQREIRACKARAELISDIPKSHLGPDGQLRMIV